MNLYSNQTPQKMEINQILLTFNCIHLRNYFKVAKWILVLAAYHQPHHKVLHHHSKCKFCYLFAYSQRMVSHYMAVSGKKKSIAQLKRHACIANDFCKLYHQLHCTYALDEMRLGKYLTFLDEFMKMQHNITQ